VSSLILMMVAEIMDFGYPQNLSPEILKLYITQEGVRSPFSSKVTHFHADYQLKVHKWSTEISLFYCMWS
jgi:hypothetical protein